MTGNSSKTTPAVPAGSAKATFREACPICESGQSGFHACIDGYVYLRCDACNSIHVDTTTLERIDAGYSTRIYDESYWGVELKSARERAAGESLLRAGEAILYARRPVRRFLDIGAGPGYLLDALADCFPAHRLVFHGIELFPPHEHSNHPNYRTGKLDGLEGQFDAGVCIEVAEHLTPRMLKELARALARISAPGALWLFNTGMPELVLGPDPGYLDPLHRGHIVSYGLPGITHIFTPVGFRIRQVPGKNHAWLAEYQGDAEEPTFEARIQQPNAENKALLMECGLLYQAAVESARASLFSDQMLERTRWALELEHDMSVARSMHATLQREHGAVATWAHSLKDDLADLQKRHVDLQAEHESVARWAHSLKDDLAELQQKHGALQGEHEQVARWAHSLSNELSMTQARCAALSEERDRAAEQAQSLREQLVEATLNLAISAEKYRQILGSRSWRLTRPLREAAKLLRFRRHGG